MSNKLSHIKIINSEVFVVFLLMVFAVGVECIVAKDMNGKNPGRGPGIRVTKKIWIHSPKQGVGVNGGAQYCEPAGLKMIRRYGTISSSDRMNASYRQYSNDNGKTWSKPQKIKGAVRKKGSDHIEFITTFSMNPVKGVYVKFSREIVMPGGSVLAGCKRRKIFYQISRDNGKTFSPLKQLIEKGKEFNAAHYMKGVHYGKNSATLTSHLVISPREILIATYIFPINKKGSLYNPYGGYTFSDVGFILGRMNKDFSDIEWETTQIVRIDPVLSTRGLDEPTMVKLKDGRILCVCRGTNGAKGKATPGGTWITLSGDNGRTWSAVKRFGFDDGSILYTPSSMSTLFRHSNGRLYWIANIVSAPPSGNSPRYPLVISEIDEKQVVVIRKSMAVIDNRQKGEAASLQLSNFSQYEDRKTHEVVVTLARLFAKRSGDWTAPCMKYTITLPTK